jgi:hypothetical protein
MCRLSSSIAAYIHFCLDEHAGRCGTVLRTPPYHSLGSGKTYDTQETKSKTDDGYTPSTAQQS